jgi:hypothetical protein
MSKAPSMRIPLVTLAIERVFAKFPTLPHLAFMIADVIGTFFVLQQFHDLNDSSVRKFTDFSSFQEFPHFLYSVSMNSAVKSRAWDNSK